MGRRIDSVTRNNNTAALVLLLMLFVRLPALCAEPDGKYSLKSKFGLELLVEPKTGEYFVSYDGGSWLGPGTVSVLVDKQWYRSGKAQVFGMVQSKRLSVSDTRTGSDHDVSGNYQFVDLYWKVEGTEINFITSLRLYQDHPYLIFVQKFPQGFKGYASGDWTVPSVVFPQFTSQNWGLRNNLYSWTSVGIWSHRLAYGDAYTIQGTVDFLLLADHSYNALILSPFSNYLVATQQSQPQSTLNSISRGSINCGIEGLVEDLPAGFEHKHILVAGRGIHNTFQEWGGALLEKAGKKVPSKYQDDTLKYPVYMDDNGAYYYDHDFKENGYTSYEDIILGVEDEARKHSLRIGTYHVLDLAQQRYKEGLFEPRSDLFPHGLTWLHEKLGKPLQLYYAWLPPGPYRKKYSFLETGPGDPPGDSMGDVFSSLDYWRDTARKISTWGGILLQHDFLSTYEGNTVMMSGVNRMNDYHKNMATALGEQGIDMQYCMQLPRNVMESTENPTLVSLQGSDDHFVPMAEKKTHHDDAKDPVDWKQLLFTSAFYGAVGIWPSRDNIQTVADPNAEEDTLIANLLGGEIQLGHRIGECNFALLAKTYRAGDGLILKPDHPIVPLDRSYIEGGAVGYTQSNISGRSWYYVLSLPSAGYLPEFAPSDLGIDGKWAVYRYEAKTVAIRSADSIINLEKEAKHEYFVLAPVMPNGMAVIGDVDKFVTMADMRIAFVEPEEKQALRIGVISNQAENPVVTGYSSARPTWVGSGGKDLQEVSSLNRLTETKEGWFWDYQKNLWSVKLDFSAQSSMKTLSFDIR
ncbi:MAG TPA: hypothetical protein VH079_02140 [Terriglobales bacterium]|nr:hypothetical protein [Terriglobales bacterium]